MDSGLGFLGFIWFAFVAWLMWSSKAQKETFLFYAWAIMLIVGIGYPTIKLLLR